MENENSENSEYISTNPLFKSLTAKEVEEFRQHAKENFIPELPINPVWHPVYRHACDEIYAEAKSRIVNRWKTIP